MDATDGYWLAGLVDGEGCFALWTRRRRVGRSDDCRVVSFVFKIALRSDDKPVLEHVQTLLGGIGVIQVNRRTAHQSGRYVYNGRASRGNPIAQFTVNDKSHLLEVVQVFRQFPLRSKKRRDFDVWAEALCRFVEATKATPPVWQRRKSDVGRVRTRFKKLPDDLYAEMQEFDRRIKEIREFKELS